MYPRIKITVCSCTVLALFAVLIVPLASAQDYQMYETQYLVVKSGDGDAFSEALAAHDQQFHAEGPYQAEVYWVANGRRTGQFFWTMGPGTFTAFDDRPSGDEHGSDWANNVMSHLDAVNNTEYWRVNEDLSYTAEPSSDEAQPLLRVRWVEVDDNALFRKVQSQIKEVHAVMNPGKSRTLFRKQFAHRDARDWAIVQAYSGWSELDEPATGNFRETFERIHGADSWGTFTEDLEATMLGAEDEWLVRMPGLGGAGSETN